MCYAGKSGPWDGGLGKIIYFFFIVCNWKKSAKTAAVWNDERFSSNTSEIQNLKRPFSFPAILYIIISKTNVFEAQIFF